MLLKNLVIPFIAEVFPMGRRSISFNLHNRGMCESECIYTCTDTLLYTYSFYTSRKLSFKELLCENLMHLSVCVIPSARINLISCYAKRTLKLIVWVSQWILKIYFPFTFVFCPARLMVLNVSINVRKEHTSSIL